MAYQLRSFKYRLYPNPKQESLLWQDNSKEKKLGKPYTRKFQYTQRDVFLQNSRLYLPQVGGVKINLHREIPGNIGVVTIRRETTGRWYTIFYVTVVSQPQSSKKTKGATPCQREEWQRRVARLEVRLKQANKGLVRKKRGSRNWLKQQEKIARIEEKMRCLKHDYWHQETTSLVQRGITPNREQWEQMPTLARKMWTYKTSK